MAFQNLPSFADFFSARQTKDFENRRVYEKIAAEKHVQYIDRIRQWSLEDELLQHIRFSERVENRSLRDEEQEELRAAIMSAGVADVDEDVREHLAISAGLKKTATLADVARSFKGRRHPHSEGIQPQPKGKKQRSGVAPRGNEDDTVQSFTLAILLEMGIEPTLAGHASQIFMGDANQAFEFCESHQTQGMTQDDFVAQLEKASKAESIGTALVASLRAAGFAASLLEAPAGGVAEVALDGHEEGTRERHRALARRRYACRVMATKEPCELAKAQYVRRAQEIMQGQAARVYDFGIRADLYVNACFWLSVVAGWSRCPLQHYEDIALNELAADVHALRVQNLAALTSRHPKGMDALGKLAHRLRMLVCSEEGFMRQSAQLRIWAPAFAGLQAVGVHRRVASFDDYKAWLLRVSDHEFADELVLAATAQCIRAFIITVPYTPPSAQIPWRICSHPEPGTDLARGLLDDQKIILGNDDVHYMLIAE
jgi:hypothetical protein